MEKGCDNVGKESKTNAMRKLDSMKIEYREHIYEPDSSLSGTDIAALLGEDIKRVYKTLVTVGKSGGHYVFMIPVEKELDLKKAASSVGEKSVSMVKSKELLGLTGYIHGGCSPIGMKKLFKTTVDESAKAQNRIFCSGGRIGLQIELSPHDLEKVVPISYAAITADQ